VEERERAQAQHDAADGSDSSDDEDGFLHPDMTENDRRSFDDEHRDLPEGWVRCWDPKQNHHFYVDEKTKRSTWNHPYDDPEYLQSLPDTHPANPNSAEAKAARAQAAELQKQHEQALAKSGGKGKVHRNFAQRLKDKAIGTKEEREEAKRKRIEQERQMQAAYLARRKALLERQRDNPQLMNYYASPYDRYGPPMSPYGRNFYVPRYGYGGGYGYGFGGMGMGMPLVAGAGTGLLLGSMMF